MKLLYFNQAKKSNLTRAFMLLPTICLVSNNRARSINFIWLWFDIVLEFKRNTGKV